VAQRLPIVAVCATLLAIWSTTWIVIKVGLHGAPPLLGAGLRFGVAGVILLGYAAVARRPLRVAPSHRKLVLVTALTMFAVPYGLVYAGETRVTAGLAAVLWSTLPLFAALFAARLLGDEPLTGTKLAGIAVGIAGVVVVFQGGLGIRGGALGLLAMLGLIAAPASGAFGRVVARRETQTMPRVQLLCWSMALAGAALLLVGLAVGPRHVTLDVRTLGSIAYMALAGSVTTFVLLYWLLGRVRAVAAAQIDLALPLLTLVEGWLFYGEPVTASVVAGALMIVLGLTVTLTSTRGRSPSRVARRPAA
jgi:drug/metabolite transporter (DMT)-like permease